MAPLAGPRPGRSGGMHVQSAPLPGDARAGAPRSDPAPSPGHARDAGARRPRGQSHPHGDRTGAGTVRHALVATWRARIPSGTRHRSDVEALVIFSGPHAYVTPAWYPTKQESGRVVPTWNYAVVHAYGRLRAIEDVAWLRNFVSRLTDRHESERAAPWKVTDAPADFIERQLGGIVGLEILVRRLDGKWKVSQNRPAPDRAGVVAGFRERGDPASARWLTSSRTPTIRPRARPSRRSHAAIVSGSRGLRSGPRGRCLARVGAARSPSPRDWSRNGGNVGATIFERPKVLPCEKGEPRCRRSTRSVLSRLSRGTWPEPCASMRPSASRWPTGARRPPSHRSGSERDT